MEFALQIRWRLGYPFPKASTARGALAFRHCQDRYHVWGGESLNCLTLRYTNPSHACTKRLYQSRCGHRVRPGAGTPRPEGLSAEEEKEWDAMMNDPVLHDLFHGLGSSGTLGGERPPEAPEGLKDMTPQQLADIIRMGSWRIGKLAIPQIELLVSQIEMQWREYLPDVRPSSVLERYKYIDTLDPKGEKAMAFNLPDPPRDSPAWPRMQIENRVYESFCFRKLHLEVAVQQDGLQVLHCVMFPRLDFDLPILSMDIVAVKGRPTLAVVDPCPVTVHQTLPSLYESSVRSLQSKYNVESNRVIPEWGKDIFSPLCVCMRPSSPEDVGTFIKYALALFDFHTQFARLCNPITVGGQQTQDQVLSRRKEIYEAHMRYRRRQLENDKTRRVLDKAFGAALSDDYMSQFMFDVEPFS